MKILVFGGTTEGKKVISMLNALEVPFVYSTKTKFPAQVGDYGKYRSGAFTVDTLIAFIKENNIKLIIHAAHPFAQILHQTIDCAIQKTRIPVFRLDRKYPKRTIKQGVFYVNDYSSLINKLMKDFKGQKLLALTGVQSIPLLTDVWKDSKSYFRILNRESSIEIATKSDFPIEQLILEEPSDLIGNEEELILKLGIQVIITKESGETGALSEKIEIALRNNVPILILKKPELPISFQVIKDVEMLKIVLNDKLRIFN